MRIAVIGCGAIADSFHIPALRRLDDQGVTLVLVDPTHDRAEALARKHGVASTARSHSEVKGTIDAAIIASPHHTHIPIAMDLLEAGVPVLCEKPLGTTAEEVRRLAESSGRLRVPVAVNHTRRFIPACREIRRLVQSGAVGEVTGVVAAEGDRFGWPAATPAMFGARSQGRGVLLDVGVHVIDLFTWWLGTGLEVESYRDDSFGGSEAAAEATFSAGSARLVLRLSWLAKQENRVTITGTEGVLEWGVYDLDELTLHARKSGRISKIRLKDAPPQFSDLAPLVLEDFLDAVRTGRPPMVSPSDALPSVEAIQACYATRARFRMPWHRFHIEEGSDA
jgi:predicted dehydrogenase